MKLQTRKTMRPQQSTTRVFTISLLQSSTIRTTGGITSILGYFIPRTVSAHIGIGTDIGVLCRGGTCMIHGTTVGAIRGSTAGTTLGITDGAVLGTHGAILGTTVDIGDVGMIHGTTGIIGDGMIHGTTAVIGADIHGTRTTPDGTEDSARIGVITMDTAMALESAAADISRRTDGTARAMKHRGQIE